MSDHNAKLLWSTHHFQTSVKMASFVWTSAQTSANQAREALSCPFSRPKWPSSAQLHSQWTSQPSSRCKAVPSQLWFCSHCLTASSLFKFSSCNRHMTLQWPHEVFPTSLPTTQSWSEGYPVTIHPEYHFRLMHNLAQNRSRMSFSSSWVPTKGLSFNDVL